MYGVFDRKKEPARTLNLHSPRLRHEGEPQLLRTQGEPVSLKDTVSTESCKSVTVLSERTKPFDRVRLDELDPLRMLGEGKLGQVCLVRHKKSGLLCALK